MFCWSKLNSGSKYKKRIFNEVSEENRCYDEQFTAQQRESSQQSPLEINIQSKVLYYYIKASLKQWVVGWANQEVWVTKKQNVN